MNVELGSFWLIKDSGCIAIVRSIIGKSNGGLKVVYTVTDNSGTSSYRMSCEYELFINIAEKLITKSELKDELNTEYVKGKIDGYNEGYKQGYNDCTEELHNYISENELEAKKQGYEEGYDVGHKDGASFGLTKGYAEGRSDACKWFEEAEKELVANDEGYGEGFDDGFNYATLSSLAFGEEDFCEHHNPSKETQEAMQEVLDKHTNKFEGEQLKKELSLVEKYPHYYKDIRHLNIIDIYRFFDLFEVTDPCLQHSLKKLAVGGKRGAKDYKKDIKEAMDTLKRWEYMQEENKRGLDD